MATLPPAMSAGLQGMDPELRRRIEEDAYSLWEADGRPDGRALEYWLRAEQAVSDQPVSDQRASDQRASDQPVQDAPRRKGARELRAAAPENTAPLLADLR
jgi:Protein of unknown function (DUF2934)